MFKIRPRWWVSNYAQCTFIDSQFCLIRDAVPERCALPIMCTAEFLLLKKKKKKSVFCIAAFLAGLKSLSSMPAKALLNDYLMIDSIKPSASET